MTPLPATEIEIDDFLAAFESGTLPKERWTHAAHLLAGACYVHRLGQSSAINHMRRCVRRYNEAVGGKNTATSGYHETITVFWIKVLDALLLHAQPITRAEFAALAVARFKSQRDLFCRFYDFDLIASREARAEWIPPTREEIEDSAATHLDIATQ
jgi:hypothetical protein